LSFSDGFLATGDAAKISNTAETRKGPAVIIAEAYANMTQAVTKLATEPRQFNRDLISLRARPRAPLALSIERVGGLTTVTPTRFVARALSIV
jgi:hypothetical protein